MAEAKWMPGVGDQVRVKDTAWMCPGRQGVIECVHDSDGTAWFSVRIDNKTRAAYVLPELEPVAAAQPPSVQQSVIDVILRDALADEPVTLRGIMEYIDHLRERNAALEAALKPFASYWGEYLAFRKREYWMRTGFPEWLLENYGIDELLYTQAFATCAAVLKHDSST